MGSARGHRRELLRTTKWSGTDAETNLRVPPARSQSASKSLKNAKIKLKKTLKRIKSDPTRNANPPLHDRSQNTKSRSGPLEREVLPI
ncbi:hypothetical protein NPIL_71971 [Nephila pilipes]|uniref:Uncharacterized protein n=1 Tax=Nephila pilipes TaxID=299642 RepID=A0A8X6NHG9_NEPPI|nr:hypothetical protein NPIL_71971 [Nephila pilipes]